MKGVEVSGIPGTLKGMLKLLTLAALFPAMAGAGECTMISNVVITRKLSANRYEIQKQIGWKEDGKCLKREGRMGCVSREQTPKLGLAVLDSDQAYPHEGLVGSLWVREAGTESIKSNGFDRTVPVYRASAECKPKAPAQKYSKFRWFQAVAGCAEDPGAADRMGNFARVEVVEQTDTHVFLKTYSDSNVRKFFTSEADCLKSFKAGSTSGDSEDQPAAEAEETEN